MNKLKIFWAWTNTQKWIKVPVVLLILIASPVWASVFFICSLFFMAIFEFCEFLYEAYSDIMDFIWPEN